MKPNLLKILNEGKWEYIEAEREGYELRDMKPYFCTCDNWGLYLSWGLPNPEPVEL